MHNGYPMKITKCRHLCPNVPVLSLVEPSGGMRGKRQILLLRHHQLELELASFLNRQHT